MPSRRAGRSFVGLHVRRDVRKPCSRQSWRRTAARVSAKVGRRLRYQAAAETWSRAWRLRRAASRVTTENRPSRQGVVRAMALSDHCRWLEAVLPTDAEVVAGLSESDFQLPSLREPAEDLQRVLREVGAEQGLRVEALAGIAQQHPADRHD